MSLLYLHFESDERAGRVNKLARSGAHIIVTEPRWPGFWELAKREKPIAVAVDFSHAPSHALETADYISKARETKETPLFLLRVPEDRLDAVRKRLSQASIVTEAELAERLAVMEREALARALEKKEAAAVARRTASAAKKAAKKLAAGPTKPPARKEPSRPAVAAKKKPAAPANTATPKKAAKKPPKKKSSVAAARRGRRR
ncbi:MAG TPA: hypothetical protein VNC59_05390 [Thermoanaerobaculia bacterium]|nr:hypothetical protein [Thermoanaerobaculia bacterium]